MTDIILAKYLDGGLFCVFFLCGIVSWKPNYTFLMVLLTQLDTLPFQSFN